MQRKTFHHNLLSQFPVTLTKIFLTKLFKLKCSSPLELAYKYTATIDPQMSSFSIWSRPKTELSFRHRSTTRTFHRTRSSQFERRNLHFIQTSTRAFVFSRETGYVKCACRSCAGSPNLLNFFVHNEKRSLEMNLLSSSLRSSFVFHSVVLRIDRVRLCIVSLCLLGFLAFLCNELVNFPVSRSSTKKIIFLSFQRKSSFRITFSLRFFTSSTSLWLGSWIRSCCAVNLNQTKQFQVFFLWNCADWRKNPWTMEKSFNFWQCVIIIMNIPR